MSPVGDPEVAGIQVRRGQAPSGARIHQLEIAKGDELVVRNIRIQVQLIDAVDGAGNIFDQTAAVRDDVQDLSQRRFDTENGEPRYGRVQDAGDRLKRGRDRLDFLDDGRQEIDAEVFCSDSHAAELDIRDGAKCVQRGIQIGVIELPVECQLRGHVDVKCSLAGNETGIELDI